MSKRSRDPRELASAFLSQSRESAKAPSAIAHFRGVEQGPQNGFKTLFEIESLNPQEAEKIEALLLSHVREERDSQRLQSDLERLKQVTAEVKAIHKQGILLLGERIESARQILHHYGDGKLPFTSWLDYAFGSRKTAYNILAYCSLYQTIPSEHLKKSYKELPLRVAYALASREGELTAKHQLIDELRTERKGMLMSRIRERLPLAAKDRRRHNRSIPQLLQGVEKLVAELHRDRIRLIGPERQRLSELIEELQGLINR